MLSNKRRDFLWGYNVVSCILMSRFFRLGQLRLNNRYNQRVNNIFSYKVSGMNEQLRIPDTLQG